jgi:TonB-linked SusC/RagA family outer membrane protein
MHKWAVCSYAIDKLQRLPADFKLFTTVLCLLVAGTASAQKMSIKGKVTSSDTALSGVTIAVKNTTTSTQTDAEGNYTINADAKSTLVFSFVGFTAQEVNISNRSLINISLQNSTQQLNDVVVVGYGTQRKGNITGAVANIKSEELMRTPSSTTSSALVGRVAGITARQTTGRPGQGTNLQIRNLGAPLYVIDGVPQSEGQFNNISSEDIESISILKDGAAALYGFRASNGVVLVTTKKGKGGDKGRLSVNTYYQLQNYTRYLSYSDAYTYTRALAEAQQNAGGINGGTVSITPETLEKWRLSTDSGFQSTNYRDYILQKNAPQKYINVNASGGNDKMNYYISLGGLKQEGILNQYDFKRYNFQTNVEGTIIKGVKFGTQLSGRIEGRYNPASTTDADSYDNPFLAILTMWPTEIVYANNNPNYINANVNNPIRNPLIYDRNVVGTQDNVWNNFGSIFYTTVQLPFGFSAKATFSYNYKQNKNELFRKNFDMYNYNKTTDVYEVRPQTLLRRNKSRRELKENFAAFQLNYNRQFADHSISATGAYEYANSTDEFVSITSVPGTNNLPLMRVQEITGLDNTYGITKRGSVIGRFNYDYRRRYLLELLGRYDGNHIYAPGKRWGLFPGVTGGWVLSEEDFYGDKLSSVMNYVKLRASWGRTGRETGVNPFDYLVGGNYPSGSYVMDNSGTVINGVGIRGLPITNITWVESTIKNVGINLGFFNNKLTAEFDAFYRDLTGIPAQKTDVVVPVEVGYSLPNENLNSDRTQGIEGNISYANKAGQISYSVSGNATLARTRNMERYRPRFGNSWDQYRNQTDHRWDDINWGYQVIGQFQSVEEIKNYPINNDGQGNTTQLPGDLKFKDANSDGVISNLDERPIGYGGNAGGSAFDGNNPYMSFGFSTGITWKGLSLNTDWAGATMQSYYRIFESVVPFQASHNSPEYLFNDRWHRADLYDNNSAWVRGTYPAIRRGGSHINYSRKSDFWIENVSYIRLRNLELVYNLPKRIISKAHLTGVKLYVTGTNLISFDNLKDVELDPEVGKDNGLVYPIMKLYTFGINLTL